MIYWSHLHSILSEIERRQTYVSTILLILNTNIYTLYDVKASEWNQYTICKGIKIKVFGVSKSCMNNLNFQCFQVQQAFHLFMDWLVPLIKNNVIWYNKKERNFYQIPRLTQIVKYRIDFLVSKFLTLILNYFLLCQFSGK